MYKLCEFDMVAIFLALFETLIVFLDTKGEKNLVVLNSDFLTKIDVDV